MYVWHIACVHVWCTLHACMYDALHAHMFVWCTNCTCMYICMILALACMYDVIVACVCVSCTTAHVYMYHTCTHVCMMHYFASTYRQSHATCTNTNTWLCCKCWQTDRQAYTLLRRDHARIYTQTCLRTHARAIFLPTHIHACTHTCQKRPTYNNWNPCLWQQHPPPLDKIKLNSNWSWIILEFVINYDIFESKQECEASASMLWCIAIYT